MNNLVTYRPNPALLDTVKVKFKNKEYWLVGETFIARGRLLVKARNKKEAEYYLLSPNRAFAIAYSDGDIVKNGRVIGKVSDLE